MAKFYQTLKQQPRSMRNNGKHRRAGPTIHRGTPVRADTGTRGSNAGGIAQLVAFDIGTEWTAPESIRKPKPPSVEYAGVRTGELIGYRLWWVAGRDSTFAQLMSLASGYIWRPGETVTGDINECVYLDFWRPEGSIFGGVYAFSKEEFMQNELHDVRIHIRSGWGPKVCVAGTVKMWGEVIEHQFGYRAQFAKLHSLSVAFGGSGDRPEILEALQERYGVSALTQAQDKHE